MTIHVNEVHLLNCIVHVNVENNVESYINGRNKRGIFMTNNKTRLVRRRRKKKNRLRKIVLIFIVLASIALFSVLAYGAYLYVKADATLSQSYEDDGREKSDLREGMVDPGKDNVSILIMGVDTSDKRINDGNPRTDVLMVATLNKEDKSVKLLSIPRDSYVHIPKVDRKTRINHAHAYGGPKATIETVENLLEIPIDYWVKVNFEAFIDVVDAINGITVDVPYSFTELDSKDRAGAIHLQKGIQDLNGEQALALARTRNLDNDIERGKRQQEIIKAIVKKSASLGSVFKYDEIIEAVGTNMATNMKFGEMKSFITYGTSGLNIESYTLEGKDHWPPGSPYYWMLNEDALKETKAMLQDHLELNKAVSQK